MRFFGFGVLVLVALAAASYPLYGPRFDPGYGAGDYDAAKREYLAAGLPWTAKDLVPPARDPKDDATPLVLSIRKRFDEQAFSRATRKIGSDAEMLKALTPFRATLDSAQGVIGKSRLAFPRDYDDSILTSYDDLATSKAVVKALAERALGRAGTGDRAGAVADLNAARALADLYALDPSFIGALVSIACDAIVQDRMRRVASARPEWIADLAPVAETPSRLDPWRAIVGEAYTSLAFLRNIGRFGGWLRVARMFNEDFGNAPTPTGPIRREGDPEGRIAKAQAVSLFRYYAEASKIARSGRTPTVIGEALQESAEKVAENPPVSKVLLSILAPMWTQGMTAFDKATTSRLLSQKYLEIVARRNNLPPSSWTPPGKDAWGRSWVYRREGKGFRLYSLGADGKDDGGRTPQERRLRWSPPRRPADDPRPDDDIAALYPALPPENRTQSSQN